MWRCATLTQKTESSCSSSCGILTATVRAATGCVLARRGHTRAATSTPSPSGATLRVSVKNTLEEHKHLALGSGASSTCHN